MPDHSLVRDKLFTATNYQSDVVGAVFRKPKRRRSWHIGPLFNCPIVVFSLGRLRVVGILPNDVHRMLLPVQVVDFLGS